MSFQTRALEELAAKRGRLAPQLGLVGLDGFVDTLVTPVAQRHGPGADFTPLATITEFGQRILAAAGRSTNIELYPKLEKLGGNGPIMSHALLAAGLRVRYVGALGRPAPHPVFADFAARTEAVSIAAPGFTTAIECEDGKIMLGRTASLDAVTYETIVRTVGEGAFLDLLSRADLVALTNWTMIPFMTEVFHSIVDRAFTILPPRANRVFFFDLADPEKRSRGDLAAALQAIARFQHHGGVTLGLNLSEAGQVHAVLGHGAVAGDPAGLRTAAVRIRESLNVTCVVIHPKESAACATRDDAWWIPGPCVEKPLVTTGAGDHFNAGYAVGQLIGLSPEACLVLGVSFSGHYVRTAQSPALAQIDSFLRTWR